jgi:hypothetical protein
MMRLQFKFYLSFISCILFANHSLAQNYYSNLGIYKDIVEDEGEEFFGNFSPKILNRLVVDGDLKRNFKATRNNDEFIESSAKVRFFNNIHLNKNISVNSYLKLQDVNSLNPLSQNSGNQNNGQNRYFKDLGLFAEEINLRYLYENSTKKIGNNFILGKFNLGFGSAWRWDRGLWIHSLAESYKQVEKLGFANVLQLGDPVKTGQYNLGFSVFTNDRKNFDNALFADKSSQSKNSAIPGDTRSLQSFNFSLDVNFDFAKNEKLSYHFSYLNLAVNSRNSQVNPYKIADQKGLVYGINYKYPLNQNFEIDTLVEYSKINNFLGNSDRLRSYLTANAILRYSQSWSLLVGNSRLKDRDYNAIGFNENLSEISLGYEFKKNNYFDKLTVQIGYKNNRISNMNNIVEKQNSQGLLLRYYKNF